MISTAVIQDRGFIMKDSQGEPLKAGNRLYSRINIKKEAVCYTIFSENGVLIALLRAEFNITTRYNQIEFDISEWVVDKRVRMMITFNERRIKQIRENV